MRSGQPWLTLALMLVAGCDGNSGGPDAGTDGGFADAALVVVPPTYVVGESRDLGLLLTMRALPNDDPESAWSGRGEFGLQLGVAVGFSDAVQRTEPARGSLSIPLVRGLHDA
jgi:hypothetical protein